MSKTVNRRPVKQQTSASGLLAASEPVTEQVKSRARDTSLPETRAVIEPVSTSLLARLSESADSESISDLPPIDIQYADLSPSEGQGSSLSGTKGNKPVAHKRPIVGREKEELAARLVAELLSEVGYELATRELRKHAPTVAPPPSFTPAQLKSFQEYAKAHPWDSESGVSPSEFIEKKFRKWLGRGLMREHINDVQPNLAAAYSTEIGRDPTKRLEGLYIRPHKLPSGENRALSTRLVSELSEEELIIRRADQRDRKARSRANRQGPL